MSICSIVTIAPWAGRRVPASADFIRSADGEVGPESYDSRLVRNAVPRRSGCYSQECLPIATPVMCNPMMVDRLGQGEDGHT